MIEELKAKDKNLNDLLNSITLVDKNGVPLTITSEPDTSKDPENDRGDETSLFWTDTAIETNKPVMIKQLIHY